MNSASTPRCPYRPLHHVKEEERARAPVFHRRVRENTPRVDGTRHEAHGKRPPSFAPDRAEGGASERGEERTRQAKATTVRSYNRRYPHRDEKEKRPYAPERPETTKSRGMNDSPWPMPRVAKMRHAVVGRVQKNTAKPLARHLALDPEPACGRRWSARRAVVSRVCLPTQPRDTS